MIISFMVIYEEKLICWKAIETWYGECFIGLYKDLWGKKRGRHPWKDRERTFGTNSSLPSCKEWRGCMLAGLSKEEPVLIPCLKLRLMLLMGTQIFKILLLLKRHLYKAFKFYGLNLKCHSPISRTKGLVAG